MSKRWKGLKTLFGNVHEGTGSEHEGYHGPIKTVVENSEYSKSEYSKYDNFKKL